MTPLTRRYDNSQSAADTGFRDIKGGGFGLTENDKKDKKQVPLRLSASLYNELARWAEDDFRSVNGQIEYLLTECVKFRKKKKRGFDENDVG